MWHWYKGYQRFWTTVRKIGFVGKLPHTGWVLSVAVLVMVTSMYASVVSMMAVDIIEDSLMAEV